MCVHGVQLCMQVFNLVFWSFFFLKPFKMLAVFVHEMCHATACWMTCGKVEGLEVHR